MTVLRLVSCISIIVMPFSPQAFAASEQEIPLTVTSFKDILMRLERLEKENKDLKERLNRIDSKHTQLAPMAEIPPTENRRLAETKVQAVVRVASDETLDGFVRFNPRFSYLMLDPTTRINRKQLYLLEQKQQGTLLRNKLYVGGSVTAIMDFWKSNTDDKFGYLMRHPTSNNQIGDTVSEAGIHSAQFSFLANMGGWVSAYTELLYDPQQSFGAGTITNLTRNQIQLRKGYVTIGNLDRSPFYLSIGKMATPFALTDTVNPFSSSSSWHAFGGLAYGALLGYSDGGLNISAELVQGGAQFRATNVPVNGTSVPSKLNNYVFDANYTFNFGRGGDKALIGVSYERGSAYCQGFPVMHYMPCTNENPAWATYGKMALGPFTLLGEFIRTSKVWPGTFNPAPPLDIFPASKVTGITLGGKYAATIFNKGVDFSFEFSSSITGAEGSPWERQKQWVLGGAYFLTDNVKLFGEGILVRGYTPLNFISGGNLAPGKTHSDQNIRNTGIVSGLNVAF